MAQSESKLSRDIMAALRARGVWCMKIHGGPTMMAGAPDILACVPACVCGRIFPPCNHRNLPVMGHFVGFETKTPTGGDPTPVQHHVHDKIREAAGHVFVVRSVQDAIDALDRLPVFRRADRPR
jgi:hypothetical protein